MYCMKCGKNNNNTERYCGHCGTALADPSYTSVPNNMTNNTGYNNLANGGNKRSSAGGCIIAVILALSVLITILILFSIGDEPESDSLASAFENNFETDIAVDTQPLEIENLRDFYTTPAGDGTDVNTIMLYLIGSDLESYGGFGSEDIEEMLGAQIGNNINLIIMTGGSTYWHMDEISSERCQYWQVKDGELVLIDDSLGQLNMTDTQTLTNFIKDTATAYPADRYSLILWNHGGGTFGGFGHDENFPDTTLNLDLISNALLDANIKFDFVGFDACLMATAETALMLEPYADYLIASQEVEPGIGWYYTDWLTKLSRNPSMPTEELGRYIIDDYVVNCEDEMYNPNATLSIIDLRYMPYTYDVLTGFFISASDEVRDNKYIMISTARNFAKDFGDGDFEQIDIIDYAGMVDIEGKTEVIAAVNSAVVYYNSSSDVRDAHGMAMYFPYNYLSYYDDMQDLLHEIGFSTQYTGFFDIFISAMSGGQTQGYSGISVSDKDWFDEEMADVYEQEVGTNVFEEILIDEKDDNFVLSLTDEQWEEIKTIELQVLLDDGEGYIDLGSDNVYEFDDDGDLKIEFDYTWVSIDQNIVPFYMEEEDYESDDWYTYGYVPALLNDEEYVEVILQWDNETPTGYVAGYRRYSETGDPIAKGLFEFFPGDTLNWIIDYYTYEGDYEDWYYFGDEYVVAEDEMLVGYEYVGDMDALIYFVLTDYHNNVYETEAVIYSDY